ncbi:Malate/L-lactate dehydrogenase [Ochromonadaceae sp. CCMP2298]|nr:Malate/L-lactate dehydrogenase [Ochromonadaceae sp. CCMP2298]
MADLEALRVQAGAVIAKAGSDVAASKTEYAGIVEAFLAAGGDSEDMIVKIGKGFFDMGAADKSQQGPHEDEPIEGSKRIPFEYLETFMVDCFLAVGVPDKEARTCAQVLIEADKRGIDSHGVGRLKPIYFDRIAKGILLPHAPITLLKETETTALVDGNLGLGLYVGPHCMEIAIAKAKKYGVGFVACRNSTHYGIAGYYATMASERGCIGFTGTNARPSIAPTFGVEPCLGTNPLCFGIPTDEPFDFVIDCATSINQRGKIEKYQRLGKDTPKGMVIDNMGNERTDTDQILLDMVKGKCALCPMGGAGDELGG